MARLFTASAESRHAQSEGLTPNGTVGFNTTVPRSGHTCCFEATAVNSYQRRDPTTVLGRKYFTRFYFRFPTNPTGLHRFYSASNTSGTILLSLELINSSQLVRVVDTGGATVATGTKALVAGQWYCVEVAIQVNSAGNGTVETRIDGVTDIASTSFAIGNVAIGRMYYGIVGGNAGGLSAVQHSDIAINDDQGANQNTWAGAGTVYLLFPASDVSTSNWTKPGGQTTSLFSSLDNAPPIFMADSTSSADAEKFVRNPTNAASNLDQWLKSYTAAGIPSTDIIALVQPTANTGSTSTTATTGTLELISNPVVSQVALARFDNGIASATATTWPAVFGNVVYNPTVTRGTTPQIRLARASANRTVMANTIGLLVETNPPASTPISATDTGVGTDTAAISGVGTNDAAVGVEAHIAESDSKSLLFNGTTNVIQTAVGGCNVTGAFAVGAVVKKTVDQAKNVITACGLTWRWGVGGITLPTKVRFTDPGVIDNDAPFNLLVSEGWAFLMFTKAAGTAVPRFHKYVYSTGLWTHGVGSSMADWNIDVAAGVEHGLASDPSPDEAWPGNILISGFWSQDFTDLQIEGLGLHLGYQKWMDANPREGWRFDAASGIQAFGSVGNADQTGSVGPPTLVTKSPTIWDDTLKTPISTTDTGVGSESATLTVPISATDTNGTTTESTSVLYAISATDVNGATTEATSIKQAYTTADTGTGVESQLVTVPVSAADTNGATTESASVNTAAISTSDIGVGSDASALVAKHSATDVNGATTENGILKAVYVSGDTGTTISGTNISAFASNTSSGAFNVVGGTTFTVTKPTGCQDGDLVVVVAVATDNIGNFNPPDVSWTEAYTVAEAGGDSGMYIAYKILSGDGASWAFSSPSNTETGEWVAVALRGVGAIGASDCQSFVSSAIQATPTISVTDPKAWIIAAWGIDVAAPGPSWTPPSSPFVEAIDAADSVTGVGVMVGYENLLGATGSISRTATASEADVGISAILEAKPALVNSEIANVTVPVPASDTGVGSDTATLKAVYALAETATDSESATLTATGISVSDTGVGAEAQSATVAYTSAETGSSLDAISDRKLVLDEISTGVENQSVLTPGNAADNEFGTSADAASVTKALLSATETSTDSETSTLVAKFTVADVNGTTTESGSVFIAITPISASDVGVGTESQTVATPITAVDTGVGVDSATAQAATLKSGADTGFGADTAQITGITQTTADTGAGVNAQALLAALSGLETSSGLESATTGKATLTTADSASGIEQRILAAKLFGLEIAIGVDLGVQTSGYKMDGSEPSWMVDARIKGELVDAVIASKLSSASLSSGSLIDVVVENGEVSVKQLHTPMLTDAKVE